MQGDNGMKSKYNEIAKLFDVVLEERFKIKKTVLVVNYLN